MNKAMIKFAIEIIIELIPRMIIDDPAHHLMRDRTDAFQPVLHHVPCIERDPHIYSDGFSQNKKNGMEHGAWGTEHVVA